MTRWVRFLLPSCVRYAKSTPGLVLGTGVSHLGAGWVSEIELGWRHCWKATRYDAGDCDGGMAWSLIGRADWLTAWRHFHWVILDLLVVLVWGSICRSFLYKPRDALLKLKGAKNSRIIYLYQSTLQSRQRLLCTCLLSYPKPYQDNPSNFSTTTSKPNTSKLNHRTKPQQCLQTKI